jgi:hypothetical protein
MSWRLEMKEYDDSTYGQNIAGVYDQLYAEYDPAAIELLFELAGGGPALELGIGTGRVALPLQEKGVPVQGIDASEAMLSKLRAKPHGAEIEVLIFGTKGGRMVRPGFIEYDSSRGDAPPGGCLKSLGNLVIIAISALIGAALAGGL